MIFLNRIAPKANLREDNPSALFPANDNACLRLITNTINGGGTGGTTTTTTTLTTYGQNNEVLSEITGTSETDYVWLDGMPIAAIQPATATISYIHTDRLGTPQKATDATQAIVWSGNYQPFGAVSPAATIPMNLRLPGQQADATGFYRNGFRDYNPALGRYLESDPIGLMGGINTYAYAENNPFKNIDPLGLAPGDVYAATPASFINGGANTLVQQYFFGETGTSYSHLALEINPIGGQRYVLQSNPSTGVEIVSMQDFMIYELGRGSSVDRYTPTIPFGMAQLTALSTAAEALQGTPYNNNIAINKRSENGESCAEAVQQTYANSGLSGITNYSPVNPTLPMAISSSPFFRKVPVEPLQSFPTLQ